jgi:hypothetical protein
MNINSVRTLLWVVDVALIGGAAFVVKEVQDSKVSGRRETLRYAKDLSERLKSIQVEVQKPAPRVGQEAFSGVSLSGEVAKPAVDTRPAVEAPAMTYDPLDSLIKVVSIQYAERQDDAKVALFPKTAKDQPNEDVIFGVRDMVFFAKGAVVKEIRRREVVFEYGPDRSEHVLRIPTEPPRDGAASAPSATGAQAVRGNLEAGIEYKADSSTLKVKREGRVALESQGERILEGVTLATTDLGDGKKGLKIESIKPGNELSRWGVETGDVLVSVNNTPMSSKAEVADYVKKNPKLGRYDVVFMRRGATMNRQVVVEQ